MAKKKDTLIEEAEKIKADLTKLKKKKQVLDSTSTKKTESKSVKKSVKKPVKKTTKKTESKPVKKSVKKPVKKTTKKTESKPVKKVVEKPVKVKKLTKKELEEAKREAEKTLEEELEEQLSDEEIENFQIEKVDMERLTNKVCDILAERESDGMFQGELWKKLKLTNQIGSRLALKLERMGTITREKLLENNRWTYKLILKKTPISTQSIENAPCLVCPVEQKCSLDGEISPRSCQMIEDWVIAELKKPVKSK
jgi:DNA-binding MarR family transcriptional regulator